MDKIMALLREHLPKGSEIIKDYNQIRLLTCNSLFSEKSIKPIKSPNRMARKLHLIFKKLG